MSASINDFILLLSLIAFYQNCWEADIGIIDRTDFDTLMQAHDRNQALKNDPAWFALRNVIFASGYRSLLAKDSTVSFASAHAKAGSYFENALSVLSKLLLTPASVMAVRALALMVRSD